MSTNDIVDLAVEDALSGAKEPSKKMTVDQHEIYDACVTSILLYMRVYRVKLLKKQAIQALDITKKILCTDSKTG